MTRKDYELIANAIARTTADNGASAGKVKQDLIINIAASLRDDNPRFDVNRFISACMAD